MPSPSGPNSYPSGLANYPGAPDQWPAAASTSSSSSAGASGRLVAAARGAATGTSTATAAATAGFAASAATVSTSTASASARVGQFAVVTTSSSSTTSAAVPAVGVFVGAATQSQSYDFLDTGANTASVSTAAASARILARAATATTSTSSATASALVVVRAVVAATSATSTASASGAYVYQAGASTSSVSTAAAEGFPAFGAQTATVSVSVAYADGARAQGETAAGTISSSTASASGFFFTPALPSPQGAPIPQVQVPKLALLVADTLTGRVAYSAPFTDVSWSCPLNKEGTASATLVVQDVLESMYEQGDRDPATSLNEFLTGPYRYSLVVAFGARVLWAGPYLPSSDPPDTPTVSIAGASFRRMMDRRIVRNMGADATGQAGDASRDLKMFSTARGAALQLVGNAIAGTDAYGRSRSLPVYCSNPPDTRGDENFLYLSYDAVTVSKALADLSARADDGPDIRFDPYLYTGSDGAAYLAYDLKIGSPTIDGYGTQGPSGPVPWLWDDGLHPISRDVDAAGLATSVWATGSGQDRAKLISVASNDYLPSLGWPVLEVAQTGQQSETDKNKLDRFAAGAVGADPSVTWKAAMRYEDEPPVGMFREGDLGWVDVRRHPLIRPGRYERRITAVSGTASGVSVEFGLDE